MILEKLEEGLLAQRIDQDWVGDGFDYEQRMLTRVGICDPTGRIRVAVALEQALRNALYHGNLELTDEQIKEATEASLCGNQSSVIEERLRQAPYCQRSIFPRRGD